MADLVNILKTTNADSFSNDEERARAVREAHAMLSRIESPWDTGSRLLLAIPNQMAAIKTAHDVGLFTKWVEKNGGQKSSMADLASLTPCEPALFARMIRVLDGTHIVWADEAGRYEMTPFAISLVKEDFISLIEMYYNLSNPLSLHLPTFLKGIGYKNPTGNEKIDCAEDLFGEKIWPYLGARPDLATVLGRYMKASASARGSFTEIYPCAGLDCAKDEALIVDIGGSMGHDLQVFRSRYPDVTGRLVLQDQPHVIEQAKTMAGSDLSIEMTAYDFFTPQPVKGARLYLLHAILHDWPDADAKRILEALKPAMKKDYSKLLVIEVVLPEINPSMEQASRDWSMMSIASGAERTESQWRDIIQAVGLKINQVWSSPLYAEAVIEVDLS